MCYNRGISLCSSMDALRYCYHLFIVTELSKYYHVVNDGEWREERIEKGEGRAMSGYIGFTIHIMMYVP